MIKIETTDKNYNSIGNIEVIRSIASVERFPIIIEVIESSNKKEFRTKAEDLSDGINSCWIGYCNVGNKEHVFQDYATFVEILKENNKIFCVK